MSDGTGATIALQTADGTQYIGQAAADDFATLEQLLGAGPRSVELDESADTEGHASSDLVVLDVEGHAIALRMPTPADAAALRRGFAAGAVTAALVIGGAAAAVAGADMLARSEQPPAAPAPAAQDAGSDTSPLHLPRPIQRE